MEVMVLTLVLSSGSFEGSIQNLHLPSQTPTLLVRRLWNSVMAEASSIIFFMAAGSGMLMPSAGLAAGVLPLSPGCASARDAPITPMLQIHASFQERVIMPSPPLGPPMPG